MTAIAPTIHRSRVPDDGAAAHRDARLHPRAAYDTYLRPRTRCRAPSPGRATSLPPLHAPPRAVSRPSHSIRHTTPPRVLFP
jgi:hypothetical protein